LLFGENALRESLLNDIFGEGLHFIIIPNTSTFCKFLELS
jgi:hypothetical protein